ncbi:MAG TPA: tRNA (adenosine(37)-N6)-threonylcarbamoyltransferase complex ATPase subunit type 1 TsaE [Patescibacteria group bacterium]|nr:tRNA (adenosine(37)-N6)-threonylcarbamoyltransferase complex ATPase subunit type 1 TsaE [Patescibacteria group bacterium]
MDKTVVTKSVEETQKLGEELAHNLYNNFLALYGDLGSGKTSFIQGLARGLGIRERITSPTFILIRKHEMSSSRIFYHVDLYRVENDESINEQLSELIEDDSSIVAVEWAEKLKNLPNKRIDIWFKHLNGNEREIKFNSHE